MLKLWQPKAKLLETQTVIEPPTEEYRALAAKIGLRVLTAKQSLRQVLHDETIPVYDLRRVESYMRRVTPRGKDWGWRACREHDVLSRMHYGSSNGSFIAGIYAHPLPFPVLHTIERVSAACPEALFFVSDYEAVRPDPFLMVTMYPVDHRLWEATPETCFVIERWDEPSFR